MGKARIKCERIDQKMNKEMTSKFFEALTDLEKENNIGSDILIEKIKSGIEKAIKKDYPYCENIRVDIDPVTGKLDIRILKEVMDVMYVDDPDNEIFLDEAKVYDPNIKVGDMVEIPLDPAKFGRVAAQNAKQSIKHDIKDFERARLIEQYHDKEHECVSATVQKVEPATQNAILTIDKNEVYLVRNEQIPGETLKAGDIIKVYVVGIANPDRKPSIKISRTHRELVKRLFELEVPEIADGTVEVKAISRVAGVHLGQSDMPCAVARKILGEDKIIGISAATLEEAKKAQADGADYLGVGAMYATNTKTDARAVTKEQLVEIRAAVDIPIVIIGGVNQKTVPNFKGMGIDGAAVVSAVVSQPDIEKAAKDLRELCEDCFGR